MPVPHTSKKSRREFTIGIREVADRARVSSASVSRALNHDPTVSRKIAKRVWTAANALDYVPNSQARALVSGKSRVLGLIVSNITDPFFAEIVQVFEETALLHNYEILLISIMNDPERTKAGIKRLLQSKVEGVAVVTSGIDEASLQQFRVCNSPLVILNDYLTGPMISNIRVDYLHGIRQGVQHLAALRHSRIAFIRGPLGSPSARERLAAFEESMREIEMDVDPELIVEGDHTRAGGMKAFEKLLTLREMPTAVMCSNDMMAMGVMSRCYKEKISVPEDLSVVGFDNIHISDYISPPLTTIELSQTELAKIAFRALLLEIGKPAPDVQGSRYEIQTKLVLRGSTRLSSSVRRRGAA